MTPESVNAEIDKSLDKPAHKLLVKVLIIYSLVLGVVIYFGAKVLIKSFEDKYDAKAAESEQWKKIALGCNADLKQSYIDRIEAENDAKEKYDTLRVLIKKSKK